MRCIHFGGTLVLQPRFDAEELLQLIERHRITHFHIVPIMFVRLLKLPEATRRRYDLSSLRFVIHGAAPCPMEVKRAMIDWWGPVIHEYYGSTETSLVTHCGSEEWLARPGHDRPADGRRRGQDPRRRGPRDAATDRAARSTSARRASRTSPTTISTTCAARSNATDS